MLLALLTVSAFAQTTINGKVTDESGEALVGVNVIIKNSFNGTITNADGEYRISSKESTPTLEFSYVGYKTQTIEANGTTVDAKLKTVAVLTDEVIVSAIKADSKSPIAYTNITKAELLQRPAADDIPYMLSLTPSAVATSETGISVGYTALRIRGTDPTRVNVTINGVPLNDSESQGVFWVNMPDFTSSVDEVQIQRGVGTSTNGAAAFGASINFQTTSINDQASARIENTAGSFNTFVNSVNASTGLLNDKFAFDVRYSKLQSDGYIDYAFSDHQSLYVSGSMLTGNGLLKLNLIHGDQQTGISWWGVPQELLFKPEWAGDDWKPNRTYNPAGEYTDEYGNTQYYEGQTDNYKQTHYQLFYSHAVNKRFNLNGAVHYTRGDGYYEQYKEDEAYADYGWTPVVIGGETIDETDLIRQKWLKNDFYGFTASANYSGDNYSTSFGGGWNRYEGDHFGEVIWARYAGKTEKGDRWYDNYGEKTDYNAFAKVNYQPLNGLNTFIDLQLRQINYLMNGIDDDLAPLVQSHNFNFFNPKVGLSYDINKQQQAYFSVGVSNREPTRSNFKDAKGDASSYPKAERLIDFETGYNYRSSNLSASINFFYMLYDDQLVPTGEKNNVGADIMTNVKDSYRTGVELVWGAKITKGLSWDANLSLSANKIKNFVEYSSLSDADWNTIGQKVTELGTTDIAYSPNVISSSILSYAFNSNIKASLISKYVGEQFFDNTSSEDRKLDAYFINNLKVDINLFPQFAKRIGLQLMVNNLFDVEYENNAYGGNYYQRDANGVDTEYTWAYYYPQAGRHFMSKLVLEF
ncbi:TonB-dependent receptor [Carboxylicivirga sediminis]|uniref:TonB-dependent receptor n=2 Tax=Carboxylicivirga sediminis TaxID=2006564 RepID=A0A941F8G9_9BACT|nr:TonB-dependent receptor [Carboxylicivirga sediminis]